MVLFPDVAIPIAVGRKKSLSLVKAAQKSRKLIGVICQKDASEEDPGLEGLYPIGVVAEIIKVLEFPDDTTNVILQGKYTFHLDELTNKTPYLKGRVSIIDDVMPDKKDKEEQGGDDPEGQPQAHPGKWLLFHREPLLMDF